MDTQMIGQIEKARQYAQDTEHIQILNFKVHFSDKDKEYILTYNEGIWHCTCHVFRTRGVCSHVMVMERILAGQVEYVTAVSKEAVDKLELESAQTPVEDNDVVEEDRQASSEQSGVDFLMSIAGIFDSGTSNSTSENVKTTVSDFILSKHG